MQCREEFLAHLHPKLDIILSDFTMPGFTGLDALRLLKQSKLSVPFIFVSGTIGEELAVAAMQEGASDYLIKDRLARLGSAVKQAIERLRLKEEKLAIEQTAVRLAAIVESSADAIIAIDQKGAIVSWNTAAERLYGYPAAEIVGQDIAILIPAVRRQSDTPEDHEEMAQRLRNGEQIEAYETVRVRKNGRRVNISVTISPVRDGAGVVVGASFIAQDIGPRKRGERFLAAEQAVTHILTQSGTLEEAGPNLLQALAEAMRWEVAMLWKVDDEANVIRRVCTWQAAWADANFVATLDQRTVLEPDTGLAGRAWSHHEPVWESTPPPASDGTARGETAGAVSIPMQHGSQTVGAIEFYSPDIRQPDAQMLAALENITSQIGQFSERRRGESALRTSEERYRTLVAATTAIVWTSRRRGSSIGAARVDGVHRADVDQLRGWGWLERHPPRRPGEHGRHGRHGAGTTTVYQVDNRLRRADGVPPDVRPGRPDLRPGRRDSGVGRRAY